MKLLIFVGILQVKKLESRKFRILEIFNFHPCKLKMCNYAVLNKNHSRQTLKLVF